MACFSITSPLPYSLRATVALALGGCALATGLLTTDPSGPSFTALMFAGRLMIAVAFNTLMIYTKVR